ncbi:unnamed protein product [Dicrocoelium dendriticum]|nr:unnamed protein product [Dicrocoelium dendriticum]
MSEWLELKLSSEFANSRRDDDQLSTKSVHSVNCEPEKEAKRRQMNDSQERSPVSHRLHFVWATRQTTDVSDQRMFMKTALRELLLHLVFITLLLLIHPSPSIRRTLLGHVV